MLKLQKKIKESIAAQAALAHRQERVSELAYRLAEMRGFAPGGELDDWLSAESQIEAEA